MVNRLLGTDTQRQEAASRHLLRAGQRQRWASSMRLIALLVLGVWFCAAQAQPAGDCAGTPPEAVTKLPAPLSDWGQILCTPYGHIITNLEGWIWTNPGSYSPVMIPSQMVRDNPAPIGNKSYFTQIAFTHVQGKEFDEVYAAANKGFAEEPQKPIGFRLDVKSVSGKALNLYFFQNGDSIWGIWCSKECDPMSRFMLLNMKKKPNPSVNTDAAR